MLNTDNCAAQLEAVRQECVRRDEENPNLKLVEKLDDALDYAARFGDHELKGVSVNYLHPYLGPLDSPWQFGDKIKSDHYDFWILAKRPDGTVWYEMSMYFHDPKVAKVAEPIEIETVEGPHWSFHS